MILWVVFWLKQSEQLLKQQKICLIKKKKKALAFSLQAVFGTITGAYTMP